VASDEPCRPAKNRCPAPPYIPLDFLSKGSIAVHLDGLSLVAALPGSERRACGGASIAKGDADPEDEGYDEQAIK
jgi:hypothetical protein